MLSYYKTGYQYSPCSYHSTDGLGSYGGRCDECSEVLILWSTRRLLYVLDRVWALRSVFLFQGHSPLLLCIYLTPSTITNSYGKLYSLVECSISRRCVPWLDVEKRQRYQCYYSNVCRILGLYRVFFPNCYIFAHTAISATQNIFASPQSCKAQI